MCGRVTSLPFTDLFRPSWQRVPNYDESLIPGRNLSKPSPRNFETAFVAAKNFHLVPSSNGWKVFLGERGRGGLYYVWNSPIFIVVIGWEMIESSCVAAARGEGEGRQRNRRRHEIREKLFRLNSIREIIFLLGSRWSSLDVELLFFASLPSPHHLSTTLNC